MSEIISEQHFSDEHLKAIGMVTIEWSMLEYMMERTIWTLANVHPSKGACFTTKLSTRPAISVLKSLAGEYFGKDSDNHKKLIKLANDIGLRADERNSIAHAKWFLSDITDDTIGKTNISANNSLNPDTKHLSPEDIKSIAIKIYETGLDVIYFLQTSGLCDSAWKKKE